MHTSPLVAPNLTEDTTGLLLHKNSFALATCAYKNATAITFF